ncbi:hypothetical protein PR048_001057 [Dryococelus australis]|uniref:Uncharacterized protein n=1 Tax=Dryococelus australis TaxID=614101 RepID=A0ABQ9IHS6_9NEOP|nr:hypothetical protein PR048_001057 [Dryococelus australis]
MKATSRLNSSFATRSWTERARSVASSRGRSPPRLRGWRHPVHVRVYKPVRSRGRPAGLTLTLNQGHAPCAHTHGNSTGSGGITASFCNSNESVRSPASQQRGTSCLTTRLFALVKYTFAPVAFCSRLEVKVLKKYLSQGMQERMMRLLVNSFDGTPSPQLYLPKILMTNDKSTNILTDDSPDSNPYRLFTYYPSIVTNFTGRMSLSAPVEVYAGMGSEFSLGLISKVLTLSRTASKTTLIIQQTPATAVILEEQFSPISAQVEQFIQHLGYRGYRYPRSRSFLSFSVRLPETVLLFFYSSPTKDRQLTLKAKLTRASSAPIASTGKTLYWNIVSPLSVMLCNGQEVNSKCRHVVAEWEGGMMYEWETRCIRQHGDNDELWLSGEAGINQCMKRLRIGEGEGERRPDGGCSSPLPLREGGPLTVTRTGDRLAGLAPAAGAGPRATLAQRSQQVVATRHSGRLHTSQPLRSSPQRSSCPFKTTAFHVKTVHDQVAAWLKEFCTPEVYKRGSARGDQDMRINCLIASTVQSTELAPGSGQSDTVPIPGVQGPRRCSGQTTRLPPRQTGFDSRPGLSLDFRTRESFRTMLLDSGFSRGSPVSSAFVFRRCFILISLHSHQLLRPRCNEPPKSLYYTPPLLNPPRDQNSLS